MTTKAVKIYDDVYEVLRYDDYRSYLRDRLVAHSHRRSGYSLRAFARDLKLAPASLANILNGKRGLSLVTAIAVAERLGLAGSSLEHFCDLVQSRHARSTAVKNLAVARLQRQRADMGPRHILQQDVFALISDWYHFAILQLIKLAEFKPEPQWIARRLGISEWEAKVAWQRLVQLGLVKKQAKRWRRVEQELSTTDDIPAVAIRNHHQQMLEKAGQALTAQGVEEREFGSVMMAINDAQIPLAKQKIRQFQDDLAKVLESDKKSIIYALNVQFFRLTEGA